MKPLSLNKIVFLVALTISAFSFSGCRLACSTEARAIPPVVSVAEPIPPPPTPVPPVYAYAPTVQLAK